MLRMYYIDPDQGHDTFYFNYMTDEMKTRIAEIVDEPVEYEYCESGFHYCVDYVFYNNRYFVNTRNEDLIGYLESLGFVEERICPF